MDTSRGVTKSGGGGAARSSAFRCRIRLMESLFEEHLTVVDLGTQYRGRFKEDRKRLFDEQRPLTCVLLR